MGIQQLRELHLRDGRNIPIALPPKLDIGGSFRRVGPEETLRRIQPAFTQCGITRIADITHLDRIGIPVAIAIRPLSKSISVAQGKGLSLAAAQVSAAMESIEVWHAENLSSDSLAHADDPRPRIAVSDLIPGDPLFHRAVDPQSEHPLCHEAFDILSGKEVLVPHSALSLNTLKRPVEHCGLVATSNGLASGNDLLEAVCHSAFEIIERHGFTKWCELSPGARAKTSIDLNTIAEPNITLARLVTAAGLTMNVFDLTEHALDIPCYVAEISDPTSSYMARPYTGRGAHIDAGIAMTRAITESAQSRLAMISGARDDNFEEDYHLRVEPQSATGSLAFDCRERAALRAWNRDPIGFLGAHLIQRGFSSWILYDHTRRPWEIPVVHGFIPKMEHLRL